MSKMIFARFYRDDPDTGWKSHPMMDTTLKEVKEGLPNELVKRWAAGSVRKAGQLNKPPYRAEIIDQDGEVLYSLMALINELFELPLDGEGAGTMIRRLDQ